jgi:hypothetical protein
MPRKDIISFALLFKMFEMAVKPHFTSNNHFLVLQVELEAFPKPDVVLEHLCFVSDFAPCCTLPNLGEKECAQDA